MPDQVISSRGSARLLPGLLLCILIALAAVALEWVEILVAGRSWIDAVVLAILLGAVVRSFWAPSERWAPGIGFSARFLLEVAIVLLGAALSAQALAAAGGALLLGIFAIVALALPISYGIGRLIGLPPRMAMLIACGNSICGNSAIAAVAPVIGAESEDIASSIAFTSVLGVVLVLLLPALGAWLALSQHGYGVLAGLTVYAVPQVLAATMPVSALATQVGTLVKLVRVLMLGPVILMLSLIVARRRRGKAGGSGPRLHMLVPWFVIGFLLAALARSLGVIPEALLPPIMTATSSLTLLAMAALGLGVDVRAVARAGPRASVAVTLSLIALVALALGLIGLLEH